MRSLGRFGERGNKTGDCNKSASFEPRFRPSSVQAAESALSNWSARLQLASLRCGGFAFWLTHCGFGALKNLARFLLAEGGRLSGSGASVMMFRTLLFVAGPKWCSSSSCRADGAWANS